MDVMLAMPDAQERDCKITSCLNVVASVVRLLL